MLIGNRSSFVVGAHKEEQMYKELYEALVQRTISEARGDDIISIGAYSFNSCKSLVTGSFPNVTEIAQQAFQDCSDLVSFEGEKVLSIGGFAFQRNYALTSISTPAVQLIGAASFQDCTSLTEANFPDCTQVGNGCFQGDYNIKQIFLPSYNNYLGGSTFRQCTRLELLELGTVLRFWENVFLNTGTFAASKTDSDGNVYNTLVSLNMTTADIMGTTGFPGDASSVVKFQCSDGYIIYDTSTSSWKAVTS